MGNLPRVTFIHLSALERSTPFFNTETSKVENPEKERMKEFDLKSIKFGFAGWTGEMEVYGTMEGYLCDPVTWLEL